MIFNVSGHIEMIRNGLSYIKPANILYHPMPLRIVKTQTRRVKRGYYQLESERKKSHEIGYAVQRQRGVKAEPDIRIVMDRVWEEWCAYGKLRETYQILPINARAEGGYTTEEYEKLFRELNPKWDGWSRWAFEFHCIEVQK